MKVYPCTSLIQVLEHDRIFFVQLSVNFKLKVNGMAKISFFCFSLTSSWIMPVCLALLEGRPRILVNRVEQTSLAFDPISSATWHSAGVGAPTNMRLLLLPLLLLPCTKADSINQGKGKVLEGRKVRLNNRLLKMRHPAADSKVTKVKISWLVK